MSLKRWPILSSARSTKRMTRKLRKSGLRFFVIGYCGDYWIYEPHPTYEYEPHPTYEYVGHKPILNLGPIKRCAWDRLNLFISERREAILS